jgi:hypothetical protein
MNTASIYRLDQYGDLFLLGMAAALPVLQAHSVTAALDPDETKARAADIQSAVDASLDDHFGIATSVAAVRLARMGALAAVQAFDAADLWGS